MKNSLSDLNKALIARRFYLSKRPLMLLIEKE